MIDLLDMFYFVEGKVEGCEVGEVFEATNVSNEIVVEVEVSECCGYTGEAFNFGDAVLAEAETGYGAETGEFEGGN